jgi:hypothetical protein
MLSGAIHILSEKTEGGCDEYMGERPKIYGPCMICVKEIINAGLQKEGQVKMIGGQRPGGFPQQNESRLIVT